MNKERREQIKTLVDELENLKGQIEDLASEERDCYDAMPENFKCGDSGSQSEAAADALDNATNSIDETIGYLNEACE